MIRIPALLAVGTLLSASTFISQPAATHIGRIAPAGQMLEARSGHSATLLSDGRVLIAGGMLRNQAFYNSAELYDPAAHRFQSTGAMNERRVGHMAVLLQSGKVLVAGGWTGHACTSSAELYDPAAGNFTALAAHMISPRGDARATVLASGDVLITGGADHDSPGGIAAAELFRAATLKFEAIAPMHFARVSHTATLLKDGRVLIAGGRGSRVNATAELFDPKTSKFTETGNLITARYKHTAGLLEDGRVLIAGGSDERDWDGTLSSAEVYDPKAGVFQPVPPMNEGRFKLPEESVRLESGQILIAGGNQKVELFDAQAGKFLSVPGQMNDSRHFMTETKLRDGSVLLAGGYPNNDQATAQTWVYQP